MNLVDFLSQKKSTILERWFHLLLEAYPPETVRFLKEEKDQFANPVGNTIYEGIKGLYEGLIQGLDFQKLHPFLDKIVRINVAQGFRPSRAIAFIFLLKKAIREGLETEICKAQISSEELRICESKIDALALLSFDIYMECREKIYEIRVNEVKNRTYRLLQRANMIVSYPEQEPDLQNTNIDNPA